MKKRFLAALLAAVMVLGLIGTVSAAEEEIDWAEDNDDGIFQYEPIYYDDDWNNSMSGPPYYLASKDSVKAYRVVKVLIDDDVPLTIPVRFHDKPVIAIGSSAGSSVGDSIFSANKPLGAVTIPNSVKTIAPYAFAGGYLNSVVIPGSVEGVGDHSFDGCKYLKSVKFLEYVNANKMFSSTHTVIGSYAFQDCSRLSDLTLSNSVQFIPNYAFNRCTALENIVLPSNVRSLFENAFEGCTGLKSVTFLSSRIDLPESGLTKIFPSALNTSSASGDGSVPNHIIFHCSGSDELPIYDTLKENIDNFLLSSPQENLTYSDYLHTITVDSAKNGQVPSNWTPNGPSKACSEYGTNGKLTDLSFTCQGKILVTPEKTEESDPPADPPKTIPAVYKNCDCFGGKNTYTESRDISAYYHDEEPNEEYVSPTCSKDGHSGGTTCKVCGKTVEQPTITEANGYHNYGYSSDIMWQTYDILKAVCKKDGGTDGYQIKLPICQECKQIPVILGLTSGTAVCPVCKWLQAYIKEPDDRGSMYFAKKYYQHLTNFYDYERPEPGLPGGPTWWFEDLDYPIPDDDDPFYYPDDIGPEDPRYPDYVKQRRERYFSEIYSEYHNDLYRSSGYIQAVSSSAQHTWTATYTEKHTALYPCAMTSITVERRQCSICGLIEGFEPPAANQEDGDGAEKGELTEPSKSGYSSSRIENDCELCHYYIDSINYWLQEIEKAKAASEPDEDDPAPPDEEEEEKEETEDPDEPDEDEVEDPERNEALEDAYAKYNAIIDEYAEHLKSTTNGSGLHEDGDADKQIPAFHPVKTTVTKATGSHKGEPKITYELDKEDDCTSGGKKIFHDYLCTDCGMLVEGHEEDISSRTDHDPEEKRKVVEEGDCEHDKVEIVWEECKICHTVTKEEKEAITPAPGHKKAENDTGKVLKDECEDAACTKDGKTVTQYKCTVCEQDFKETTVIVAEGHKGEFVPNKGEDMTQNSDCTERTVKGSIVCSVCETVLEKDAEYPLPGLLGHTWGDWVANEDGKTETRTCTVCGKEDKPRTITSSGSGSSGDDGNTGDDDDNTGSGGGSSGGDSGSTDTTPSTYRVETSTDGNGTVRASASSAAPKTLISLTITPRSGYELDMLRVITSTTTVPTSNLGGGRYRFTMPSDNVTVTVTFSRTTSGANANWTGSASGSSRSSSGSSSSSSTTQNAVQSVPKLGASGQLFFDIPASHWAAGEINWANQMGYMNGGSGGSFNPDGNITFQQMWMVLARLTGSNPSNMADARRWAVNSGYAEGADPAASLNRQQLVTALYRCAHLMGTSNRNTTSLAGFPDSRTVPTVARDAFAWAVANGIIGGNANGRLDPNGTLTRAQFAVILYRFSQRV